MTGDFEVKTFSAYKAGGDQQSLVVTTARAGLGDQCRGNRGGGAHDELGQHGNSGVGDTVRQWQVPRVGPHESTSDAASGPAATASIPADRSTPSTLAARLAR